MANLLSWIYFSIGCGFWIGCAVKEHYSFRAASWGSILRGLIFGICFWPLAVFIALDKEVWP